MADVNDNRQSKDIRVLILEDNPADAELLEYELKGNGLIFNSNLVATRDAYIKALREYRPDIILSDYDLPQYNGVLALDEAKKRYPDVPFILVTGAVSEDRAIEVLTSGAQDYVLKHRLNRLVPAVKRALIEAKEHRALKVAEEEIRKSNEMLECRVRERTAELEKEIAERKRTLKELRESEEKFRSLFHYGAVPMTLTALDYKIMHVNQAFSEMLGYSESELSGMNYNEITHPDDIAAKKAGLEPVMKGEKRSFQMEKRYIRKDGRIVWADMSASYVNDANGKPAYIITHCKDITDHKRTEEALRESEERFRTLFESARDAIIIAEPDEGGRVISANPAACRLFGYRVEELLNMSWKAFFNTNDPQAAVFLMQQEESGKGSSELTYRCKDGTYFTGDVSSSFFADRNGNSRAVAIIRDITARKRTEQELKKNEALFRAANKKMESFSYTVSHDLQAPLRTIKGFSQMILEQKAGALDGETKRKIAVIQENTDKMQRLIDDLLTLSRVGMNSMSFNTFDMTALVKDTWKELEEVYPEKPLVLNMKDLQPAYGDRGLIRQVLANLLSNAVKYSPNRKRIEVEVGSYQENDADVYYVKDKGIGFDMEYHDKIFEVFRRLHSAAEFEGTGIGLSIAQRIVHLHGGKIWAEGKVNEGAVFYFLLPRERKDLSR